MVEKLIEPFTEQYNFEKYRELGGILNRKSVDKAKDMLLRLNNGEKIEVNEHSLWQVKGMLSRIGEDGREEAHNIKYLYVFLRDISLGEEITIYTTPEEKETINWVSADQDILGEVLLLRGDTTAHSLFIKKCTNFFQSYRTQKVFCERFEYMRS